MLILGFISELLHFTSNHIRFSSDFTKTALSPVPKELQSRVAPHFKAYLSGNIYCQKAQTLKWLHLMANGVGR